MIVNKTILEDKFKEGDFAAFEYLIDNAETDKQVETILALQKLSKIVPQFDERYISVRSKVLFSLGIDVREFQLQKSGG